MEGDMGTAEKVVSITCDGFFLQWANQQSQINVPIREGKEAKPPLGSTSSTEKINKRELLYIHG
jgi:hypothetical protein